MVAAYESRDEFLITLAVAVATLTPRGSATVCRTILRMLVGHLQSPGGAIVLLRDGQHEMVANEGLGPAPGLGDTWHRVLEQRTMSVVSAGAAFPETSVFGDVRIVPITSGTDCLGAIGLCVASNEPDAQAAFTQRLMRVVAGVLALVVVSAAAAENERRLHAEIEEGRKRAVELADERQRALERVEQHVQLIDQQRSAISQLSVPVIRLWTGVLAVPLVGAIDSDRAEEVSERLLNDIASIGARVAIIDLTGVESADTATSHHLLQLAQSVRLLGCQYIVCGMSSSVARGLISADANLGDIRTFSNLQAALQWCLNTDIGVAAKTR